MSESATGGRPWHLWLLPIVLALFNSIGCVDFFMVQTRNEAYLRDLGGFTSEQLEFFYSYPGWAVFLWGVAVSASMLGALLLLARRGAAVPLSGLGLFFYVVCMARQYGFTDFSDFFPEASYMVASVVIFVSLLGQLLYARAMKSRGLLA